MSETREYWAFISYRHLDNKDPGREWASWLAREIETYEVPAELVGTPGGRGEIIPERIYPVFRDEDELSAGADLSSPIYQALRQSKSLVVICSPRALGSRYVGNEIRYFKKLDRPCSVLALMIEGEPHAGDQRECFPTELRHPVDANGDLDTSSEVEPIAADCRLPDGSQGWHNLAECRKHLADEAAVTRYRQQCELAKLKIIAGILGVPLGQLVERDKAYQLEKAKKRARIVTRVAAAMAVLAVLAIVAGVVAVNKRKEAASERDNALRAQATAENLIHEILYNMEGKLKALNRLDLLDDAARIAENHFANLPDADVSLTTEANRSSTLDSRARILHASGDLDGALEKYRASLDITRRLSRQNPDSPTLRQVLVTSLKNVADILVEQNLRSEADDFYDEAAAEMIPLLEQSFGEGRVEELVAKLLGDNTEQKLEAIESVGEHPEKVGLIGTAADIFQGRADGKAERGDYPAALAMYELAKNIHEALHIAQPDNPDWRNGRITSLYSIGSLYTMKADIPSAKETYERMAELVEIELKHNPDSPDLQRRLAAAFDRLGSIAATENRSTDALRLAIEARDIWKQLSDADPSNLKHLRDFFVGAFKLASVQIAAGDEAGARSSNGEALAIAERLFQADSDNAVWRRDLAFALERQADYQREDGDIDQMRELRSQAIGHHRLLANGEPDSLIKRTNLSSVLNGAGLDHWLREDLDGAMPYYEESERLARSVVEDLAAPDFQSRQHLAQTLANLTDISEASERYGDALRWCRAYLALIIETRDLKVVTPEFVAGQIALLEQRVAEYEKKAVSQ